MATISNKRRWLGGAVVLGLVFLVLASPYFILFFSERASHWKYSDLI
jgi:hypothetical protein